MGATEQPGLREYLNSPEAERASAWQLEALASLSWPPDIQPSADTFRRLQEALSMAVPAPAKR